MPVRNVKLGELGETTVRLWVGQQQEQAQRADLTEKDEEMLHKQYSQKVEAR